jgi:hypothetical protein
MLDNTFVNMDRPTCMGRSFARRPFPTRLNSSSRSTRWRSTRGNGSRILLVLFVRGGSGGDFVGEFGTSTKNEKATVARAQMGRPVVTTTQPKAVLASQNSFAKGKLL